MRSGDRDAAPQARDLLVVDEPTTGLHPADLERLLAVLRAVAERGATVIVVEHHPDVVAAADHVVRLGPGGSHFTALGVEVEQGVPGEHNVLNALAAIAACREAGIEPAEAAAALASFPGAGRRFERRGTSASGAVVYDDYAHHPTEVRATIEAARTLDPDRLIACFQPHLFSRTARLAREFGAALALADAVCVLDVYPARERAEDYPGVSGWLVATGAADAAGGRPVYWTPTIADAERLLSSILREGDVLLTLGAGDVDRLAARLVEPVPVEPAGGAAR